jgi:hypothetical protein
MHCSYRLTISIFVAAVVFGWGAVGDAQHPLRQFLWGDSYNCGQSCSQDATETKADAGEAATETAHPLAGDRSADGVTWHADYLKAIAIARQQNRMLLVYFCDACGQGPCNRFKAETLDDPQVRRKLRDYVCVQVSLETKVTIEGQEITLLEHPAFAEMLGRSGIAIVDYQSKDPDLCGSVVSTFPITESLWYTPEQMAVILDLPPGTLTQRTLIYAVRIHPEKPASTDGQPSRDLLEEAQSHSQYQAAIERQGHHYWASRFVRIVARLPGGLTAREVCAESWPGQRLVDAAIECVRCWRLSDGHWSAVQAPNQGFGYDMRCGNNGVWYATGIFGTR